MPKDDDKPTLDYEPLPEEHEPELDRRTWGERWAERINKAPDQAATWLIGDLVLIVIAGIIYSIYQWLTQS